MSRALIVIDMQQFVVDRIERGVQYFPLNCMENMKTIVEHFRQARKPVLHVRHQSSEKGSQLHESSPLALPIPAFGALAGEAIFIKNTSSAFSSTELLSYLKEAEISEVVIIGAVAGFCVNSTVRMGADLGLSITVVKDAVISFELAKYDLGAQEIHNVTLALLDDDFARVVTCSQLQET